MTDTEKLTILIEGLRDKIRAGYYYDDCSSIEDSARELLDRIGEKHGDEEERERERIRNQQARAERLAREEAKEAEWKAKTSLRRQIENKVILKVLEDFRGKELNGFNQIEMGAKANVLIQETLVAMGKDPLSLGKLVFRFDNFLGVQNGIGSASWED